MAYQEDIPTLLYSPSVTVYVGHKTGFGEYEYYDVSADVTTCSVSRNIGSCSTFSFSLMNHQGKYNGKFEPMDLCTIYAQKEGRVTRLITGYITSVPNFTLYPNEFDVSGSCSLYKLQRLWWDKHLNSSWAEFMLDSMSRGPNWNGYEQIVYNVLTRVGGFSSDDIVIGELPSEVEEWARNMYETQRSDIDQLVTQMDEFYDILMTTGITGGGGGTSAGAANVSGGASAIVEWAKRIADENKVGYADPTGGHMNDWARRDNGHRNELDRTPRGYVDCSSFCWYAISRNGWGNVSPFDKKTEDKGIYGPFTTSSAEEYMSKINCSKTDWDGNVDNLRPGDILLKPGHHMAIYIGDGRTVEANNTSDFDKQVDYRKADKGRGFKYYFRLPQAEGAGSGTVLSGDTVPEQIWNYAVQHGCSDAAAAGMIGNASQESGFNSNAGASSGAAYGLFQFEKDTGEASSYHKFAEGKGKSSSDVQAQLDFLWGKLPNCFKSYTGRTFTYPNGTVTWWPTKMTFDQWKKQTDPQLAAEIFCRVFERPSLPNMPNRRSEAQKYYDKFHGKSSVN